MPEVTRRRTGEFMRHLFAILVDHPEGMQAGDAITAVRKRVKLTDYESGAYPSGGERFEKILRFATQRGRHARKPILERDPCQSRRVPIALGR